MHPRLPGVLALCTSLGCASSATVTASAPVSAVSESDGIQLLELTRIESSPAAGSLNVRVANGSLGALLLGVDVRAEPGMWLGPPQQKTSLFYIPPRGERVVTVPYAFAQLSPEATLHVRVGIPEEHTGGWVHIPEPTAVRRFHMGGSDSARAFLSRFDSRAGRVLTVYALQGTLRSEQIDAIVAERDHAVSVLSRMLGVAPPSGLTLVFYPDGATKTLDTNHVGSGMTKGRFIVEVINDTVGVDPYHELAHVVSGQLGWAPAWLNEGFAVYAAEYLGADALALQGWAGKTVDQAACSLLRTGDLFPMAELMQLADIGPSESRPKVSYAQAGSFTGFLAQTLGIEALRMSYETLSPTQLPDEHEAAFANAFGMSSEDAARSWIARIEQACP
jgi:hypothetical protein